jgi:predicted phosphate transport protein (TIGR00153 family)
MKITKMFGAGADFYKMLSDQAQKTLEGLETLMKYMESGDQEVGKMVDEIESQADELRRVLIDELLKSFSTPIDREDIFALSRAIDDVIDYAKSTVDEMIMFKVEPNEFLKDMVERLIKGAREINSAIQRLQKNPHVASEHAVRAKSIENDVEKIYRKAIVQLFEGTEVVFMLKMREIYRHLSNAADRCDEAANIIADIVVKTV